MSKKCKSVTISGKRCHRKATHNELCWQHATNKTSCVIVVDGYIGCGKTTLCKEMVHLGFVARDLDYYTQPFIKNISKNIIPKENVGKEWNILQNKINEFIDKHKSVVFCGATALRIFGTPYLLKFPKDSKLFWLKVSQKQSVKQALKRNPKMTQERLDKIERGMAFQLASFKTRKGGKQIDKKGIVGIIKYNFSD